MNWFVMRPVHAGWATLTEVKHQLTLLDVLEMHIAMDAVQDAERRAVEEARRKR